jgi:hypothetical protein
MLQDYSNKWIHVLDHNCFIQMALELSKYFGKVTYSTFWEGDFPVSFDRLFGAGLENYWGKGQGVQRVDDFWAIRKKPDLYFSPDIYYAGICETLRDDLNKPVFSSFYGEELEIYREEAKKHYKSLGLPIIPYDIVYGFPDLRKYLKDHVGKNVFIKTDVRNRGDFETFNVVDYELSENYIDELEFKLGALKYTYKFLVEQALEGDEKNPVVEIGSDTFCIDGRFPENAMLGIEIKGNCYLGHWGKWSKFPPEATQFNIAMADTLKNYGYRNFISTEIRTRKEKGINVAYQNDLCCFDDKTEILTDSGWKLFKDLDKTEKVATLNTENKGIEYQKPTHYIAYDYLGKLINISSEKKIIECAVTPNHLVLRTDRHKKKLFKERADSLTDKGFIPRTGKWAGRDNGYFTLPAYHKEWNFGGRNGKMNFTKIKNEPEKKIAINDWFAFLAWYLSEGSMHDSQYGVNISQTKHKDIVRHVIRKIGFKMSENEAGFVISSVQLASYLHKYGLCSEKYIPDYVKESTPEQIRIFLDHYNLGDGSVHKGQKVYFTTSKKIADDLQELIFKVGKVANIFEKQTKGTICKINGKEYTRKYNALIIGESNKYFDFWFETQQKKAKYITKIDYDGKVYCVSVPNETVYVRKNGKPFWSSNCRLGHPPNELELLMISNLPDIISYGAQGELIEPIVDEKFGVQLNLHSTWAAKGTQVIKFPDKLKNNVRLRRLACIEDQFYVIPRGQGNTGIGCIVTKGKSFDDCIEKIKPIADEVKGDCLERPTTSFDTAAEEIDNLKKMGIDILNIG